MRTGNTEVLRGCFEENGHLVFGFHSLEERPFYGSTNNVLRDVKRSSFLVLFWNPLEKDQWPFALLSEKLVGQWQLLLQFQLHFHIVLHLNHKIMKIVKSYIKNYLYDWKKWFLFFEQFCRRTCSCVISDNSKALTNRVKTTITPSVVAFAANMLLLLLLLLAPSNIKGGCNFNWKYLMFVCCIFIVQIALMSVQWNLARKQKKVWPPLIWCVNLNYLLYFVPQKKYLWCLWKLS